MNTLTELSKFLALMLRHHPEQFGLVLDEEGFADLVLVWAQIQAHYGKRYSLDHLNTVVEGDRHGKKRYELRNGKIRAMYGHSVRKLVTYASIEPPDYLYHGTTIIALPSIRKNGLTSQKRQYVHLTVDLERAQRVASRQVGDTVMLRVFARDAHQAGIVFHSPENDEFLARAIPPQFIEFPEM